MADWYCDITLPQAGYANYSTTPVAAGTVPTKPEDGNGKAAGPATMATRVITFTGLPTAAQAITVGGVTFTAVASGATGNQFNIGADAATTAANLRAAINASTTSLVNPTPAMTCPLRNAVNATNSGATITLYTRIAGSEWNSITETSTLSNVTNNQWSGGTDGAWGYFFNTSTISWPTSVSAGAYGAFVGAYLGAVAAGDIVHIRTKRSGSNVVLTWPSSTLNVAGRSVGTLAAPLVYLADAGIKWSGDAGVFTMTMNASQNASRQFTLPAVAGVKQVWAGVKTGEFSRNWRHELTGTVVTANYYFMLGASTNSAANFVELRNMEITGAGGAALDNVNSTYRYVMLHPPGNSAFPREAPSLVCEGLYFRSAGAVSPFTGCYTGGAAGWVRAIDCVNDHTGLTLASSEAILQTLNQISSSTYNGRYEFILCRFLGFPAAANLSGFQGLAAKQVAVFMRDCEFPNIKCFGGVANGGYLGSTEDTTNPNVDLLRSIRIVSSVGNRPSIFETARWGWGWFDSAAPVVSSSLLPDGVTPFSLRCAVTTESGNVAKKNPVRFPRMSKINSLADGDRTTTLRILVDNNLRTALGSRDPKNDELWIDVSYVGTDGKPKLVSSRAALGATPAGLSAGDSGDWSATAYDVNGGSHSYTPLEISVSCPGVAEKSEVALIFSAGCQSSSIDDLVFLDPEWTLA